MFSRAWKPVGRLHVSSAPSHWKWRKLTLVIGHLDSVVPTAQCSAAHPHGCHIDSLWRKVYCFAWLLAELGRLCIDPINIRENLTDVKSFNTVHTMMVFLEVVIFIRKCRVYFDTEAAKGCDAFTVLKDKQICLLFASFFLMLCYQFNQVWFEIIHIDNSDFTFERIL